MGGDALIGALTNKYLLVDQEIFIPTKPIYLTVLALNIGLQEWMHSWPLLKVTLESARYRL